MVCLLILQFMDSLKNILGYFIKKCYFEEVIWFFLLHQISRVRNDVQYEINDFEYVVLTAQIEEKLHWNCRLCIDTALWLKYY